MRPRIRLSALLLLGGLIGWGAGVAAEGDERPRIVLSGIIVTGDAEFAFIIHPDGTERIYQSGDCLAGSVAQSGRNRGACLTRLLRIYGDRIVVVRSRNVYEYGLIGGNVGPADDHERYLTKRGMVENVCTNFLNTACERVGMIEVDKEKPVHHVIYPMCFEVFVEDWREQGSACLQQAMYLLKYVAYVEFF